MKKFGFVLLLALAAPAWAAVEDKAGAEGRLTVASPRCDAKAIREKGGAGVREVKVAEWKDGYVITYDPSAANAAALTKALHKAGCF